MAIEVATFLTSVKATVDIVKGINALKSDTEKDMALSNVLEKLLSVQQDALELQERYYELTKKLDSFGKWSEIENKYQLKAIAPGVFVYESKQIEGLIIPKHWLCTNCFR